MKKTLKIVAVLMCAVLLLGMSGCFLKNPRLAYYFHTFDELSDCITEYYDAMYLNPQFYVRTPEDNRFVDSAYIIYQTVTDGWKNGIEEQTILNNIEDNIVETNKNILKELLNRKFIDQDCYEFALSLSSIDEFSGTEQLDSEPWKEKYEELEIKYKELGKKYEASQVLIKKLSSMIAPEKLKELDVKFD